MPVKDWSITFYPKAVALKLMEQLVERKVGFECYPWPPKDGPWPDKGEVKMFIPTRPYYDWVQAEGKRIKAELTQPTERNTRDATLTV